MTQPEGTNLAFSGFMILAQHCLDLTDEGRQEQGTVVILLCVVFCNGEQLILPLECLDEKNCMSDFLCILSQSLTTAIKYS